MPIDPITIGILAASAIGAGASVYGASRTNKTNQKIAEDTRASELAMWHMANEYNHPSQQMARLKEAGLNPHLVHGNANQADVPRQTPDTPELNPYEGIMMPVIQLIQQVQASNAEIAKTRAEIEYIQGNTANQDLARRDYELRKELSHFDKYIRERQLDLEKQKFGHTEYLSKYSIESQQAAAARDRARAELFLEQASSSRLLSPAQVSQIRQNMRFQADLHEYNVKSQKARATIDAYQSSDFMLELMKQEMIKKIQKIMADTEKANQRKLFGIDFHKDNILRYPFGASQGWSRTLDRSGSRR